MHDGSATSFLADCPARLTTEILSDKWAALVLFALHDSPRRHGELIDLIGGISRKVLTETLRQLQSYGLVERQVEEPRQITYHLTVLGKSLIGPIEALNDWARENGGDVVEFQEASQAERTGTASS